MDKIEKIRQEIERRIALYSGWSNETVHPTRIDEDKQLLSFLDTLEDEPETKDLEQIDPKHLVHSRGYDEAYLNDCIARAKKSWEGVDVDRYMDMVRGKEPVADGLEEAARQYGYTYSADWPGQVPAARDGFIAGAEWRHQKDRGEFAKIKAKTWIEGFDACKEQMIKGAVEGFIFQSEDYYPKELIARYNGDLKHGDKVKVIVIKED